LLKGGSFCGGSTVGTWGNKVKPLSHIFMVWCLIKHYSNMSERTEENHRNLDRDSKSPSPESKPDLTWMWRRIINHDHYTRSYCVFIQRA